MLLKLDQHYIEVFLPSNNLERSVCRTSVRILTNTLWSRHSVERWPRRIRPRDLRPVSCLLRADISCARDGRNFARVPLWCKCSPRPWREKNRQQKCTTSCWIWEKDWNSSMKTFFPLCVPQLNKLLCSNAL